MARLRGEYVYTGNGPQRPIFLAPTCAQVRFAVSQEGRGTMQVQVSHDAPEVLRRGAGRWQTYAGGLGGAVAGATAVRLLIGAVDGWVSLMVEQEMGQDD